MISADSQGALQMAVFCAVQEKHMPLVKEALASVEAGKAASLQKSSVSRFRAGSVSSAFDQASATPGGVIANSLRAGSWWFGT